MGILTSQQQCRKKTRRTSQKSITENPRKKLPQVLSKQHTGHMQSVTTKYRKEKNSRTIT
ncbi:hypothetical protein KFK09_021534 [Dendrobium nobile]|uniref:Uncharacterized protein n=1 Tax=Dendrobium nobile TaxID=94219 RepID=A0A8T3APH8_DENNO|nr:hypothetical protein KFK09_023011 [Dendrobium nobile]KAI0498293.1 hypothetical protein KFK09_021534 [Dendrobium nobile]